MGPGGGIKMTVGHDSSWNWHPETNMRAARIFEIAVGLGLGGIVLVLGQSVPNDIPENQQLTITYGDGARTIHAPGALMHPGCTSPIPLYTHTHTP